MPQNKISSGCGTRRSGRFKKGTHPIRNVYSTGGYYTACSVAVAAGAGRKSFRPCPHRPTAELNDIFLGGGLRRQDCTNPFTCPLGSQFVLLGPEFHPLLANLPQVDWRRRGSPFAEDSEPSGSRNGSTGMRS
jgi:hypothetical protein